jgi:hypothetical protein
MGHRVKSKSGLWVADIFVEFIVFIEFIELAGYLCGVERQRA